MEQDAPDRNAAAPAKGPTRVRFRDGVPFCLAVFVAVRVTLSLLGVVTVGTVQPPSSAGSGVEVPATRGWHNAIDGTDRWDALWFERIARDGYDTEDSSAAFFPGYPLAIRAIGSVTPFSELSSGLIVSNVAFLCALIVLFALTTLEYSDPMARRTVLLLACFPASFFFLSPYSESLFLVTSLLAFWWARTRRPWLAGLAGFAGALTRSVGVLLVPALLVEAWGKHGEERRRAIFASLIPLLAPISYFAYWQARSGDPLHPLHAQDSWFRTLAFPLVTLGHAVWLGIAGILDARGIYWTADLLLTAIIVFPFVLRWRILAPSYVVYVAATCAVVFSYPLPERPLLSDPRLLVVLFPAFWTMADLWTGTRFAIVVSAFVAGFAALSIAFMNWGFVF
jgi:Mannosyltransferase (PIG-V)